ncbi:MAG: hypothetical protein WAO11_05010, partial [Candidatus Acidiferrum sp.]
PCATPAMNKGTIATERMRRVAHFAFCHIPDSSFVQNSESHFVLAAKKTWTPSRRPPSRLPAAS